MMKKIKIGFCGAGTVGSGALEILEAKRESFLEQGIDFEVTKILVRDSSKSRPNLPKTAVLVESYKDITQDSEIDIVVEVLGGVDLAKDIVFEALGAGKSVVSANKALIAGHYQELLKILKENPKSKFGFEAAVGGGLPLISSLQTNFNSDEVIQLAGILNGTTNFILSKMESENASYSDVLEEAQALGFAEANPSADVDGYDARSKILILTQLLTGKMFKENGVFMQGITEVSATDFEYAHFLKSTIKLLGVSKMNGDKVSFCVSPFLVPNLSMVAHTNGASNIVEIESSFCEKTCITGQGAGKFPTGNSIVTDLLRVVKEVEMPHFNLIDSPKKLEKNFKSAFYVRFWIKDQIGVIRRVGALCEKYDISIDSVVQLPIADKSNLPFVLTTDEANIGSMQKFVEEISAEAFCNGKPFFMPIFK